METRIQRHRKYRAELIKEGSDVTLKEKPMTTTALPIKEVMTIVEEEKKNNSYFIKERNDRVVKYVLLIVFLIALIVGIIMFGIYAFGGSK